MDNLEKSAKNYEKIMKIKYHFKTVDQHGLPLELKIGFQKPEFTHIVGLNHLEDIRNGLFLIKDSKVKNQIFQYIKDKKITLEEISKSTKFKAGIFGSFNEKTNKQCTIQERLHTLVNIKKAFEKIVKNNTLQGTLMRWDKDRCNVPIINPNNSKTDRNSVVDALYALAVNNPTKEKPNEKIYFFFCDDNGLDKKTNVHSLKLFSAFADCTDLTQGQVKLDIDSITKEVLLANRNVKTRTMYQNLNGIRTRTALDAQREQILNSCFNNLKVKRKDHFNSLSNNSKSKKYDKAKSNFQKAFSEMSEEDKKAVITRFIDISEDKSNQKYHELITDEIKEITGIDDIEKEKKNLIAQVDRVTSDLQSSTGDLKKKITSFALFPERDKNEQWFPNQLRFSIAGSAETIEYTPPPFQNQLNDMVNKAIEGLTSVAFLTV